MTDARLRIGELSRRSGVSPELLRAWERRYGLLQPTRSPGGLRLYSAGDLERVRAMQGYLAEGVSAAEAAALAALPATEPAHASPTLTVATRELAAAAQAFDEPHAQAVIDNLLGALTVDALLSDVVVPFLHELGERWDRGEISVAEEHFASGLIRGRLLGLAREWGRGHGPRALLACAPGEQHDLGLIAFGLALRGRGWRIGYLGADTPVDSVASAARAFEPAFVVVSAVDRERFRDSAHELSELARRHRLCIGGAGADDIELRDEVPRLTGSVVVEADRLSALARSGA